MEFVDLLHLINNPPPPVGSLWGDSLVPCKGLTLLHSGSKMGKSMMVFNLAIAGARGDESYLGHKLSGPFNTLIFQGEIHLRGVWERADTMLKHSLSTGAVTEEQLKRVVINLKREERLSDLATFIQFQEAVRAIRPQLIVLDPLAHVLTTNENDNAVVGAMLERLATLRDDPGAAIILVHHDSKTTEATAMRSPQQRSRGADRLNADPDCILSLVPGPRLASGPTGKLHIASRYGRTVPPFGVALNENTLWFEAHMEMGEPAHIVHLIKSSGCDKVEESVLLETIEAACGYAQDKQHRTALRKLGEAMREGLILEEESGIVKWYSVRGELA